MKHNKETNTVRTSFAGLLTLVNVIVIKTAFVANPRAYGYLWVTLPLLAVALYAARQKNNSYKYYHIIARWLHHFYERIGPVRFLQHTSRRHKEKIQKSSYLNSRTAHSQIPSHLN